MALLNLLLFVLGIVALIFQLITPVILNIPAIAVVLIGFAVAIFYFRRRRQKSRLPIFAGLNLLLHTVLLCLSLTIFFVITLPSESPEDSPAVIQGIRNMLASYGLIEKPKVIAPPVAPSQSTEVEKINAPDPSSVQITVEDEKSESTGGKSEKP